MLGLLHHLGSSVASLSATALAEPAAHAASAVAYAAPKVGTLGDLSRFVLLIPALPIIGVLMMTGCALAKVKSKVPAFLTVLCLLASFAVTVWLYVQMSAAGAPQAIVVKAFDWINVPFLAGNTASGGLHEFTANFSFYVDSLTVLWMLFVTGLATAIALYASEYMSHDVGLGYVRFFFAFNLFVFSMTCLVMGDNLLMLYLGWEGVGLCSYLLIGYFYQKPSAVAAAKKAFIMNRIGDLGLALGIMLTFVQFGSIEYSVLFDKITPYIQMVQDGRLHAVPWQVQLIPILFMVGAFGKSAQLPLYVWLPDAMEGPTPVSALIHAATMVTAGVYLVARFIPFFQCSEYALPIVAWVGTLTALLAATIGMAQFDIKRIMAYSTVSQLGFMFAGLGVLTSQGAAFHVFTHAFFKATLFLSCGAVMHGFAGQLDLRKLSGVMWMKGWAIVGFAMLIGCLNLAGFPFTAGFYSKDMILAEAFTTPGMAPIGWILLFTAGLTAYYTFRVFFRVFVGPKHFEPGDELHAHDDHAHDEHPKDANHAGHGAHAHTHAPAHKPAHAAHAAHDFHPHPPGWAINLVLATLALASIAVAALYLNKWVPGLVDHSTAQIMPVAAKGTEHAADHAGAHHANFLGLGNPHEIMYYVSGVVGAIGILIAFVLHYLGRKTAAKSNADALLPVFGPIATAAQHKWYVDEIYNAIVRIPLLVCAHIFHAIDKLLVDGIVNLFGRTPRGVGQAAQVTQGGLISGYAVGMAAGVAIFVIIALMAIG